MKRFIFFLFLSILFLSSIAQPDTQLKVLRLNAVSSKIMMQKKDSARVEMYSYYSVYFTNNNIYPNADAIDLIDAYNKRLNYTDIKNNATLFKPLLINTVTIEPQKRMMLMRMVSPGITINGMKNASAVFNQKQETINEMPDASVPGGFKQILLNFKNVVLPRINDNAANIPSLQLDFFLTSLNDINRFIDQLSESTDHSTTMKVITELMDDFTAYDIKPVKTIQHVIHSPYPSGGSKYATKFLPGTEQLLSSTDEGDLPNADVYVYTRDSSGNWSNQPKPDAFNVYYGANALQYSLTAGCDTLSFFKYHPSVPASTLPVILAKGNYCFVLQDISTNKLYLRTDINLRDNKVIDDQKLIKLCFKADK